MKKLLAVLIILTITFSITGCEMDENTMGMFMSFMSGFTGSSGSAFNASSMSGGQSQQNQQWAAMGGQMSNMWMSQSENNQQGRGMSSMLQANQIAFD